VSRTDLLSRAEALRQARTPYVLATVVRAERPTSAKPGDSALILADGTLDGFVGGTCAESTVRLQGLRLLETGASTLLRITPEDETGADAPREAAEGLIVVNNPCLSGGSLEIFLEAMIPAPLIHVYGQAPVARALMRVGAATGYDMVAGDAESIGTAPIPPDTAAVVVASHGRGEESALAAALLADVPYIALVASRKRGDAVLASLGSTRERVHSPAGLDIGARTASEIAVSILAEIVATRPAAPADLEPPTLTLVTGRIAVDPVCGMDVAVTATALQAEHAGETYYFCGSGCKVAFLDHPHQFAADA
jgi:xanthine dehydrogenase accessory factor